MDTRPAGERQVPLHLPTQGQIMLQLFGYWRSSASYRVRIVMQLKGLDYEQHPVNLRQGEQREKAYRRLNPQGLVPFLVDGEVQVGQSVAITPDELGSDWQDGKVHLPLETHLNGALFGAPNAGVDMTFNFFELIAHAAKTRPLGAGCIIGSGTVSNYDRSAGSSCLAELRMLEIIESGQATTPFLCFGDTVSIAMQDRNGMSLFGTILQKVTQQDASQTR